MLNWDVEDDVLDLRRKRGASRWYFGREVARKVMVSRFELWENEMGKGFCAIRHHAIAFRFSESSSRLFSDLFCLEAECAPIICDLRCALSWILDYNTVSG